MPPSIRVEYARSLEEVVEQSAHIIQDALGAVRIAVATVAAVAVRIAVIVVVVIAAVAYVRVISRTVIRIAIITTIVAVAGQVVDQSSETHCISCCGCTYDYRE